MSPVLPLRPPPPPELFLGVMAPVSRGVPPAASSATFKSPVRLLRYRLILNKSLICLSRSLIDSLWFPDPPKFASIGFSKVRQKGFKLVHLGGASGLIASQPCAARKANTRTMRGSLALGCPVTKRLNPAEHEPTQRQCRWGRSQAAGLRWWQSQSNATSLPNRPTARWSLSFLPRARLSQQRAEWPCSFRS